MGKLPRRFFDRPTIEVAPDLLGKIFVRRTASGLLKGRIVEDEAYTGVTDPGSHAYRGPTARTRVMFGPAGHVYVYRIYGMHVCINLVTEPEGTAGAVLLRALEPLDGIPVMERNRGGRPLVELCNGPAKLCQAMEITSGQNGADLEGDELWVEDDGFVPEGVTVSARVGLTGGADLPRRFFLPRNPFISPGRPSVPLPADIQPA